MRIILLDKLLNLLDLPDSDYWSDVACDDARKIIDDSPETIFTHLLAEWRSWPYQRQEHLAYILGKGVSNLEKTLIEQMLTAEDPDVAFRAREANDDFHNNA